MDKYRGPPGNFSEEDINLSRIPVFVFPATVYFNARDRDHLKQILTIYNPYEFPIRFKVLSNAPSSTYTVIDPEGSIKSKNCVDLIIRVSNVPPESSSPQYLEHKFRVQIYHYNDRKMIGRRDVGSVIHFGNLPPHLVPGLESGGGGGSGLQSSQDSAGFSQCATGGSGSTSSSPVSKEHSIAGPSPASSGGGGRMGVFLPAGQQPNYVVILTALVCIIGLMLPLSGDGSVSCGSGGGGSTGKSESSSTIASLIPSYLHVTVNQKMLAAYTLGLVTMVIFRP